MSLPVDFYVSENTEKFANFKCDQTVVLQEKFLKHLSGPARPKSKPIEFSKSIDWWPSCNSYYAYLEDTDALSRKETLQNAYQSDSSLSLDAANVNPFDDDDNDPYNERDAQIKYLNASPLSFVVLGKPGLGEQELGKLLANHWGCVYVDPQTLIEEEIQSGSRAGQCIEFNLRCGRGISAEVIMRLAEKRIASESARHRGFVLCGFPLIANDLHEEDPVSSESAVFNVREIFDECLDNAIPEGHTASAVRLSERESVVDAYETLEDEEVDVKVEKPAIGLTRGYDVPLDLGSAKFAVCTRPDPYRSVDEQIDELLALVPEPFLLIYIVCDNAEVVNKRRNYGYDILQDRVVDLQKEETDRAIYAAFANDPSETSDLPEGIITMAKYDRMGADYSNRHDLLKLPHDFESSVRTQLKKYRHEALGTIEKHALMHDPQHVIRLDGRMSPCRMFHALKLRLDVLPYQKPLIPRNLNEPDEPLAGDEGGLIADAQIDYADASPEAAFDALRRKHISSPMFKWTLSDWGTKCPVYMRDGIYVDGDPNYAVQFMNKIFFLADERAYVNFYRNPRTYLLPPFPKLSSKIYVVGSKLIGTHTVAKCLGYMLNTQVLFMDYLQNQFLVAKREEFVEAMRQKFLAETIKKLAEERSKARDEREAERMDKLNDWKLRVANLLETYCERVTFGSLKSSEENVSARRTDSQSLEDHQHDDSLLDIEDELKSLNVDCACIGKDVLENPDLILYYAPDNLIHPHVYEPPHETDEEVLNHVEEMIQSLPPVELTLNDLIEIYMTAVKDIEERDSTAGWIVAGMPPDLNLLENVRDNLADETFILYDDSAEHDFLVRRFKSTTHLIEFEDFQEFFLDLGMKDVAKRCPRSSVFAFKDRVDEFKSVPEFAFDDGSSDEATEEEYYSRHPRRRAIDDFVDESLVYDLKVAETKRFLEDNGVSCNDLHVAFKPIKSLLRDVVNIVENKYRQRATPFTDEDRAEELKDFGEPLLLTGEDVDDEEEAEGSATFENVTDSFFKNRHYGDTFHYCPVAFKEKFVLWRGKDEFAVKHEDKLYFMHDEVAMKRFVADPKAFLFKYGPPDAFPPPRICVTGLPGSGKTTMARRLARNLGLYYADFVELAGRVSAEETHAYVSSGEPFSTNVLNQVLVPFWFTEPKRSTGFVLDGFPRRITDVDYMIKYLTIPDAVVDLTAMPELLTERLKRLMTERRRQQIEEEKAQKKMTDKLLMAEWREKRETEMKIVLEELRQRRYDRRMEELDDEEEALERDEDNVVKLSTQISYDSIADERDVAEAKLIVDERFPRPILSVSWPTEDEMSTQIDEEIETMLDREVTLTSGLKDACNAQLLPWTSIDANLDGQKTFAQIMKLLESVKFRNRSLFERCYDISTELAESLLNSGYYFLSKFGRTCPVRFRERSETFQSYLSAVQRFDIYPVIYRQYVYFLTGKKNRDKFVANPIDYTREKFEFPLIRFRVAVVGPPKCGKTTLARRFSDELGLKHVSIGKSIRYVLKFLPYTELAKTVDEVLRNGWQLTAEMEIKCVEAMCYEATSVAVGCVFDGFPNDADEVRHMAQLGLLPHLVLNLVSDRALIGDFLSTVERTRGLPIFSGKFVDHRCKCWVKTHKAYRLWLDEEYQIAANVAVQPCKWGVWSVAHELAASSLFEIRFYHVHARDETALRLSYMQVSPLEYVQRRSAYKEYCPCCLYGKVLTCADNPPDRTGLVQFKYYYYCLCPDHVEEFISDPEKYLPPYNPNKLPIHLPKKVRLTERPTGNLFEDGLCIVCYVDNLPTIVRDEGILEFAVAYRDTVYLFGVCKCRDKFLHEPERYANTTINFRSAPLPDLNVDSLPILGYLEQSVSHQVIGALLNTVNKRPLICGLSVDVSAALNVALHLKKNNPNAALDVRQLYEDAYKLFDERHERLARRLREKKRRVNPFLYYEEPLTPLVLPAYPPYEGPSSVPITSRVPVPDERFDYLCNYFKPLSKVPAFLNVVDIAGLVKGASEGQGLGNAFLSHISACDAIFNLLRAFEDDDITHIEGEVNPVRDLDIIAEELRLKDEETLLKKIEALERVVQRGADKKLKPEYDTLLKIKSVLIDQKQHIRFADWNANEIEILNKYLFLTSKPALYLINLSEKDYINKKNKWLAKIKVWVDKNDPGAIIIPFSGAFEQKLLEEEDPELRKKILQDNNTTSALDKIIVQGYKALQLEYFFTAGPDEVKAWTIQKGTKAPQAAGRIHTDFEKGFIMAEVMKFNDFKEEGSEAAAKAAGKYRQQGRNYVVEDGDIIFFKFNAGAGLKDAKKK